ncbi:MAG: hypothetical protein LBR26_10805, partial [Prevotella sp.]|nr:hypothetical protein [Prevotella sp.]
ANKFSSPPTGNILPVGYKSRLYPCSGIALSANTFNPVAAFFPAAGFRRYTDGALGNVGAEGNGLSSSPLGSNAYSMEFTSGVVNPGTTGDPRPWAFPVRCVKEFILVFYNQTESGRWYLQ